VLDVYKLYVGKMSLKKKEVAVRDIIKENISELMPLMKDKGISFKAEVKSPCDSLWVLCDPTRIAQVIGSLVRNSVDFVEDKVGKITIRGELIENERISNTNKQIIITLTKCKLLWQITAQIFHPIKQKTFSKKF
ncbi:MAG: hypothetical protein WB587_11820, partial [Nitrososphaeraceae archaeon]